MFGEINQRIGRWLAKRSGRTEAFYEVRLNREFMALYPRASTTFKQVPLTAISRIAVADVALGIGEIRTAWFELFDGTSFSLNTETVGWALLWGVLCEHLPITHEQCTEVMLHAPPWQSVVFDRTR